MKTCARILLFSLLFLQISPSFGAPTCTTAVKAAGRSVSKAPLLVISGPSGAGKTTVIQQMIKNSPHPIHVAVGVTTRGPRPGETDGSAYHFWTKEKFQTAVKNGEFIEWAEVHGNFYGTLKSEVEQHRLNGTAVFLIIDVQGAQKVRSLYPETVSVFLKTSDVSTFEQRLRARGTETEDNIQKRVKNAKEELKHEKQYDHTVINDTLSTAVSDLSKIFENSRQ